MGRKCGRAAMCHLWIGCMLIVLDRWLHQSLCWSWVAAFRCFISLDTWSHCWIWPKICFFACRSKDLWSDMAGWPCKIVGRPSTLGWRAAWATCGLPLLTGSRVAKGGSRPAYCLSLATLLLFCTFLHYFGCDKPLCTNFKHNSWNQLVVHESLVNYTLNYEMLVAEIGFICWAPSWAGSLAATHRTIRWAGPDSLVLPDSPVEWAGQSGVVESELNLAVCARSSWIMTYR